MSTNVPFFKAPDTGGVDTNQYSFWDQTNPFYARDLLALAFALARVRNPNDKERGKGSEVRC